MKKLIVVLLFIVNIVAFGQQAKSDEKLDFIKKMMFESLKMSFPQNAEPISNKLKTDYVFPWLEIATFDKAAITNEITNFVNKYDVKLDEKNVVLFSSFSENFDVKEKYLNIEIIGQQLKNETGVAILLKPKSDYLDLNSKSTFSEELDSNGNVVSSKESFVYDLEKTFESKTSFKHINGTITVETKHLESYSFKKITHSDIGKEIVFGLNKIKVLSIKDNVFTYQLIEGDGEFSHFATNENDISYKDNYSRNKVSQQDIDFVKLHPHFTQADVNQHFDSIKDLINEKKIIKNIYVVKYDGNVANVYFYKPADYIKSTKVLKIKL